MPTGRSRAGLGVIDAMQELNARLERDRGVRLHVRIGIDTGTCRRGGDGRMAVRNLRPATRSTWHPAFRPSRQPDTVVISGATLNLSPQRTSRSKISARRTSRISQARCMPIVWLRRAASIAASMPWGRPD